MPAMFGVSETRATNPPTSFYLFSSFFFAFPVATMASTSSPAQCGPFSATYENITSSSSLLILPFDAQPIRNLTNPNFDPVTKTWNYTLDKLPLKVGTQFIVTLDNGYGATAGNVSLTQTVGNSSDSSCLTSNDSPMDSFFTIDTTPLRVCALTGISWNTTRYTVPPYFRGFIPGGEAFDLQHPFFNTTTPVFWTVNVREGTQVVLLVQPESSTQGNGESRTSPLMTVTSTGSDHPYCLSISEFSSTGISASATANSTVTSTVIASISTSPEATKSTKSVNIPGIVGGVLGGIGFIAIVCAAIILCRPRRRKIEISAFDDSNAPMAPTSAFAQATPMRKGPLNAPRERGSQVNWPSGKLPLVQSPLPTATSSGASSSNRLEDARPLPRPGAPARDEAQAESVDILVQPRPDQTPIGPAPPVRRPPAGATRPRGGAREDGQGGEAASGEPASESRPGPSNRARTDGRAGRNRSRTNVAETETEYFRQTGAGAVRVVELPPSYNEVQFR